MINDAFTSLRSLFIEWDGFLINNRYVKKGSEITWENYQKIDFVDNVTASYVEKLTENGQYSFQVKEDDSIFQIHYGYDSKKRKILSANLSFYYSGIEVSEDKNDLIMPLDDASVGWLRIDYDSKPTSDGGVVHASCHMHLSTMPQTRIIVDRIPNPKQFVEFVIAICYPNYYKLKILDDKGMHKDLKRACQINDPLIPDIGLSSICDYSVHLRIPDKVVVPVPEIVEKVGKKKKN